VRRVLALLVLAAALGTGAAQADDAVAPVPAPPAPMSWRNPVVADDFPDPSAARVDGVYWAVSTSTARAPGFPILSSPDLLHWDAAGTVFQQRPAWAADSLWAPELVVDQAGTRVYYSARRRNGRLCVAVASAPSPAGPYADHGPLVCQRAGSIDPTQVRDAAGRPYLVWKEDGNAVGRPSRIWIRPLRSDGLGLTGHKRELLRNADRWEGSVVEAPEIVARGGWLYLFYSGNSYGPPRHCAYALGVARARSVFGPWRRDPANPILRSNRTWRCPGHASPVSDQSGRLFLLYHAYPASGGALAPREALLDQVTWTPHGWPAVNGGRGPSTAASIG
jgi:xylan 1,4-beta-xylosidase